MTAPTAYHMQFRAPDGAWRDFYRWTVGGLLEATADAKRLLENEYPAGGTRALRVWMLTPRETRILTERERVA